MTTLKIKKILSFFLVLTLFLTLSSVSCFASKGKYKQVDGFPNYRQSYSELRFRSSGDKKDLAAIYNRIIFVRKLKEDKKSQESIFFEDDLSFVWGWLNTPQADRVYRDNVDSVKGLIVRIASYNELTL